jgi:glycosyltransferase involved in cell wall biosynthesis
VGCWRWRRVTVADLEPFGLARWRAVRVAVTLEQCWHRVPGGTAVAARAMVAAVAALDDPPDLVGVAARHRVGDRPTIEPPLDDVRHLPLPRLALYEAWSRMSAPHIERAAGAVDLAHGTTIVPPAARAPIVVTVHDLAFVHEPAHFTAHGHRLFRRCLARIRERADLVLCSSTATMTDCADAGIRPDRLRLVLLGCDGPVEVTASAVAAAQARQRIERPYVLSVGTLEPRKNLRRLVAAFGEARAAGALPADAELLLVGPAGWGDGAPPAVDGVRLAGFVPDEDLAALYAGALVTCQPSVREGFGLPVLEAMAHGSGVVTSRGTSTEEVAGGAAVLVEPTDVHDIARGLADGVARRDALVIAGRARAAELTWTATAARVVEAYREVAR